MQRSSRKIDSSGGSRQTPSACKYIRTAQNSLAKIRATGVFANQRNLPSCRWLLQTGDPTGETIAANRAGSDCRAEQRRPTSHEPEKGNQHTVFHGLAQVIVQSGLGGQGKLTLTAASEGLATGETVIVVAPTAARPAVPGFPNPRLVVLNWLRSPCCCCAM